MVALVGIGRVTAATGPGGTRGATAEALVAGAGQSSSTVLPELSLGMVWQLDGADREAVLGALPLAAPLLTAEELVTAVPGGVVLHDRATGAVRRIDVPTSGASSPRVLPDGTVVVLGGRDAWFLDRDGILARTTRRDLSDVTPVVVGEAVLAQTELGGLVRLTLDDGEVGVTELRGLSTVVDDSAVPRFELGVHAVDQQALWVGSRDRGTDEAVLWRLDPVTLGQLLRIPLGTTDVPTMVAVGDGGVVVAHDDVVLHLLADGQVGWSARPGPNAEVLGYDDGRVLVRHAAGRVVFEVGRGQLVARATTVLLDGPRSAVAAGEVLLNDEEELQSLRIFDATVARRLEGRPLSIAGQDDGTVAWVTLGLDGAPVLRLQPTPDRSQSTMSLDAIDLPLPIDRACAVAGAGDLVVWHDGANLREVAIEDGTMRSRLAAGSSAGSTVVVGEVGASDQVHVVDARGVVRRYARGLDGLDVLAIGDDPVLGVAVDGDVVVAAGGTGRIATLGSSDGYVRGLDAVGATRWLVRIRQAVASPPSAAGGTAAIRQVDGAVAVIRDGLFVADVPADPRSLDPAIVDERGVVLRDGRGILAAFPQGEVAWVAQEVASLPGLASDGRIVVARRADGLVGLDRQTGSVLWEAETMDGQGRSTTPLSVPVIADDRVVVALHDGVVVLDLATGDEVDRSTDVGRLAGPIVATGAGVIACMASGDLRLVG